MVNLRDMGTCSYVYKTHTKQIVQIVTVTVFMSWLRAEPDFVHRRGQMRRVVESHLKA